MSDYTLDIKGYPVLTLVQTGIIHSAKNFNKNSLQLLKQLSKIIRYYFVTYQQHKKCKQENFLIYLG